MFTSLIFGISTGAIAFDWISTLGVLGTLAGLFLKIEEGKKKDRKEEKKEIDGRFDELESKIEKLMVAIARLHGEIHKR